MVSLDNCHNKLVGREFIKYSINGNESIFLGDEEKSIISEELDAKESKTYIIRCWVSDTVQNCGCLRICPLLLFIIMEL